MLAVLLAAGEGKRLAPFLDGEPKPLVELTGTPLIERLAISLIRCGIERLVLVVSRRGRDRFERWARGFEERSGIEVTLTLQSKGSGTGAALLSASNEIEEAPFLVVNGDLAISEGLARRFLLRARRGKKGLVLGVRVEDVREYGALETRGSVLKKIVEKPSSRGPGLINGGLYYFNSTTILEELPRVGLSPRGELEITSALNLLADRGELEVFPTSKRNWVDVGRPWDVIGATRLFISQLPSLREKTADFKVIPPVFIHESAQILKGAIIGPYVSIERGAEVDEGVELSRSVILEGAHVGARSFLKRSVVGRNAEVPKEVRSVTGRCETPLHIGCKEVPPPRGRYGCFISSSAGLREGSTLGPCSLIF